MRERAMGIGGIIGAVTVGVWGVTDDWTGLQIMQGTFVGLIIGLIVGAFASPDSG